MNRAFVWFLIGVSLFIYSQVKAQYYFYKKYYEPAVTVELGAAAGLMYAFTDLGGGPGPGKPFLKDVNTPYARPCASLHISAQFRKMIGLKLSITRGAVEGADSILKNKGETFGRYDRNLHFRSRIDELRLAFEIHPWGFLKNSYRDPPEITGHIFVGVGYYHFNPQGLYNNKWHALQPLRTEGQGFAEFPGRKPYRLWQFNLNIGTGLRWKIADKCVAAVDLCYRYLFTDYLDDASTTYIDPRLFSKYLPPDKAMTAKEINDRKYERNANAITRPGDQRGNPNNNDAWVSVQFSFGFALESLRR